VHVATHHEDGFRVHADLIRPALSDRTAAVLVNSPCNPTGAVIGEEDLRGLARLCAERGIVLICDETYGRYVYDGRPQVSGASLARELGDHVVVISSFSKIYSMTGWRVGYALGPRELIRAVTAIQSHVTSNPTSFAMRGALAALRDGEPFVEAIVAELQRRRDLVVSRLRAIPDLPFTPPAGGFYVFPRFTAYYEAECPGSAAMAERLLDQAGVAAMPGEVFGDDGHLRLAFIAPFEDLLRGLERLVALFEKALEPVSSEDLP
jgi:aspartate aminotransferase